MKVIKHGYGKRTVSLLLAVILVLCPLQVKAADNKAADNKPTIEIGNYIQMGTYDGKPIVWRCVANDDNGPLMLSDKVLCDYMPYDAQTNENKKTGSHRRNTWRDKFGSNHWRDSNIRSWLNSNEEAGNVKWLCGNPPTSDSVYPADKAYDQKAGFLRSFRSDELGAIRKVKQRSIVSHPEYTAGYIDAAGDDLPYNTTIDTVAEGYNGAYYEDIWDRVFLLDVKQLKTVKDNLKDYHIAQNRSNQPWNYWLRTPITTCNHDMRYVTPQGDILRAAPYLGYWGVRPAFYLNTDNYTVSNGAGTSENPYVVSALNAQEYTIDISGAERADVKGDWNVNTDEYLKLYMNEWYTTDPAYTNVTVPVYTIQKPRSDKDNMVILYCAEGYTKSQQKMFVEDVKRLWGKVLQIEPYRSMADRFNVYALCTPSEDTFKGNSTFFNATEDGIGGYKGVWRNHVLERIIGPAFIEKIHDAHIPNKTRPNENADHDYRQYDYVYKNINQFVVLANSGKYFGGSHDNKEKGIHYLIASAKDVNSAFIQRHELGHGLFHLGDEYNSGKNPVAEELYTTSLNMSATKDSKKVMWKQLLGFHHTYTCPHYDGYYPYNSSRDCLMRESTIQNDFCDVCRLQGIKVMSQLITNPPELYVAVPEVKKYKGDYRNPTENPSAFERANSSAYENYKYDRNNRLLSGDRKNSFDYRSMNGQEVELRTIIQNLSDTQAKKVTLRLWVEHSDGKTAVTRDGKQVYATKEFDIPVWDEKSKFWTKGALNYKGSNFDSGLVNCSLVYKIPENAILQQGDTIGFDIVDSATNDVLANDDTEKQPYANVTIQYQLEDGTDVPNTEPTTFTVPVGKKVDWQPPKELHSYTFVQAEGMDKAVPKEGMTIRYIYKRSEESPKPPVIKITPPQAITVANGTAYGDMNLPDKVNIATEGKTVDSAKVTWDTTTPAKGKYDPAVKTEQTVTLNGKVTCPESIDANGVPLTTTITVTISAEGIVGAPIANPTPGTYLTNQSVALKSTTADAKIYYTTDGSEPTITNGIPGGTTKQYTAPIAVTGKEGQSSPTTIKAIAVKNDMQDSKVETFAYTIEIKDKLTSITAPDAITVANGTAYGDMNLPDKVNIVTKGKTVDSAKVTWDTNKPASGSYDPSVLQEQTVTLNGKVTCPDGIDANGVPLTTTITITIRAAGIVEAPTANPTAGTYTEKQSVELTSSAKGATIYYTTDGSEPTITGGTQYTAPISVKGIEGQSKTTTIKAIAVKKGMQDSSVKTFTYNIKIKDKLTSITAPDAITVANGTAYSAMNLPKTVNIKTEGNTESSAPVTWDTDNPADGSYDPTVKTEQTVTLNGKVTCPESIDDNGVPLTTTITITISAAGIVGAPTANPTAGIYSENQSVELKSTTADATIYYTTDGSEPTITTGTPGGTTKQYTAPISVTGIEGQSNTTTIKAIAVKNDLQDSKVETFAYTIQIPEATYTVTVTNGSGTGEYAQGETVKITAGAAPGGQQFKEWEVVSGTITLASSTSETTTFTMPAEAVSVKANYEVSAKDSITSVEITGIDAPKANTALDTSADCATKGVSGTTHQITWDPSATEAGYNTSYTASVTLTAATDYEFSNSTTATINGNTATSVKKNDDGTLTVTYKFPATAKPATAKDSMINYETHVQTYGWQGEKSEGQISGTYGESKRLEGIRMHLTDTGVAGGITYRTHVQTYGWQNWKSDGEESGTSGQAKRLEAIQIKLTGEMAEKYDIYYRVHAQTYGWLGWSKNGEAAGTEGLSKRLEAIQIRLEEKGHPVDGSTANSFVSVYTTGNVRYRAHVQSYGWQGYVSDGKLSGTSGQSKRLEGINISLSPNIDGGITYRTHVQTYGWQKFVSNGTMAGTSGQSKRLEAIEIKLTGNAEKVYDVYYRVHCQHFGWLGWAKNGESAGSAGYGYRLEAIQIQLVKKGGSAPGSTSNAFQNK